MSEIPDHLPSGPEWESSNESEIVARCAADLDSVLRRYQHALGLAARIGILETVKHDLIRLAIESALDRGVGDDE